LAIFSKKIEKLANLQQGKKKTSNFFGHKMTKKFPKESSVPKP
jgi:hypothetical protein